MNKIFAFLVFALATVALYPRPVDAQTLDRSAPFRLVEQHIALPGIEGRSGRMSRSTDLGRHVIK
jgi:hypothetical protein